MVVMGSIIKSRTMEMQFNCKECHSESSLSRSHSKHSQGIIKDLENLEHESYDHKVHIQFNSLILTLSSEWRTTYASGLRLLPSTVTITTTGFIAASCDDPASSSTMMPPSRASSCEAIRRLFDALRRVSVALTRSTISESKLMKHAAAVSDAGAEAAAITGGAEAATTSDCITTAEVDDEYDVATAGTEAT